MFLISLSTFIPLLTSHESTRNVHGVEFASTPLYCVLPLEKCCFWLPERLLLHVDGRFYLSKRRHWIESSLVVAIRLTYVRSVHFGIDLLWLVRVCEWTKMLKFHLFFNYFSFWRDASILHHENRAEYMHIWQWDMLHETGGGAALHANSIQRERKKNVEKNNLRITAAGIGDRNTAATRGLAAVHKVNGPQ